MFRTLLRLKWLTKMDIKEKLGKIKLLIMDLDGVLTDGGIILNEDGTESKRFNVQDGHGIKMLQRTGIKTAIISGRETQVTQIRAEQLGIVLLFQGQKKKLPIFEKMIDDLSLTAEQVAYIGDDLLDLPLVKRAGFGVAVDNAVAELKEVADYTTEKAGGYGAVREVIELIMKTTGTWDQQIQRYLI